MTEPVSDEIVRQFAEMHASDMYPKPSEMVRSVARELIELRAAVGVEPVAWMIEYGNDGEFVKRSYHGHNCIADYRALDPQAKATELIPKPTKDGGRG